MALSAVFTIDLYPAACARKRARRIPWLWAVGLLWAAFCRPLAWRMAVCVSTLQWITFCIRCCWLSPWWARRNWQLSAGDVFKRATGHGAFAGLAAGSVTAFLHYGLTLPGGVTRGFYGGWIAVAHRYPGLMAQCFWTAVLGLAVNLVVAVAVSFGTKARPEKELKGLVYRWRPEPHGKFGGSGPRRWQGLF